MEHEFIKHLKKDHEKQRSLGKALIDATGPEQRDRLRNQFYEELYPHMVAEEASIFDFLKSSDDAEARADALESLQEHHVSKIILRELMRIKLEGEIFTAKAKVLVEHNNHHMDEEEEENFAALEKVGTSAQLDELFNVYQKSEEAASSR